MPAYYTQNEPQLVGQSIDVFVYGARQGLTGANPRLELHTTGTMIWYLLLLGS